MNLYSCGALFYLKIYTLKSIPLLNPYFLSFSIIFILFTYRRIMLHKLLIKIIAPFGSWSKSISKV